MALVTGSAGGMLTLLAIITWMATYGHPDLCR